MAKTFTTEITSDQIPSDNPIHQRLLKAYVAAAELVKGELLEVGCGEGRGIDLMLPNVSRYAAIDKIAEVIAGLRKKYPTSEFHADHLPPLRPFPDSSFDTVITFQVIEHIENDSFFLKEIFRVLRPGGIALITTPNRPMSLSRNPWHIREYTADELTTLCKKYFPSVETKGITGNEKVMEYYQRNKKAVDRMMRWDVLNLQYRLPASLLRVPYEWLNRRNRNNLKNTADDLVKSIHHMDYVVTDQARQALDLFMICRK
jgi:SAM-dependent methyltransferase